MNDSIIMEMYKKYEPFFSNWYLKRYIGEGGFAKVFEIVRNDFGKEYTSALKIVTVSKSKSEINTMRSEGMTDGEIREYLHGIVEDTVREIQLMYELKGKGNIVGYEDHAVMEHEDGMGWDILIKMEYLTSLSTYIRQNKGMLAKQDIIKLGIDICKALEACQKYNIIHRDIKADNIFISDDGDYKLGDFGIARVIERKDQTLSKKGTSAYMAPEVYKGQTYTSAVDIYSLGIVLYRLLNNNRAPFLPEYPKPISLDDRDHALMLRMSGEKFPKPSQTGKSRLTEIVLKACAYRPQDRYSSPGFMRQELEALLLDEDELAAKEMIMIYEEGRSDTTSSRQGSASFGQSNTASGQGSAAPSGQGIPAPSNQSVAAVSSNKEPTAVTEAMPAEDMASQNPVFEDGATEVLRGEATEVLRGEATEVLRSEATEVLRGEETEVLQQEPASAGQEVKVLCKNCGEVIERDKPFCPLCGAKQEEAEPRKKGAEESAGKEAVQSKLPVWWKKALIIGGACAAALVLIVIVAVSQSGSSAKNNTSQGSLAANNSPSPTPSSTPTPSPTRVQDDRPEPISSPTGVQDDKSWVDNVLMKEDKTDFAIGSKILKANIITITFLDTLDEMPDTAWDVSVDKNGSVMAWAVSISGSYGYNLYIAGEGGVTANADSSYLFCGYRNLENVYLNGNFHTENAADMSHMFRHCEKLTSLDVSGFDTSNVKNMSNMFYRCKKLVSVDVSGFDTSKVTQMSSMFSYCSSLTSVDVSSFDTSKVWDMSGMFSGCSSLTSVDVSGFDTSRLINYTQFMFDKCDSLTSLDLSNFTSEQIDKMNVPSGVKVISQGGSSSPSTSSPQPSPSQKPAESTAPDQQPAQPQNPDPSGPPPGGSGEQPEGPPRQ